MTEASLAAPAAGPRRRAALALVLGAAAALRLAHWAAVAEQPFFARLAMDSQEYDRWARALAAGDWLGAEPFFQAPLYPYLVALVYRLAGPSTDAVYLLQIAVAVAALAALARAADRLLGPPHGLVAAALGAVYAPFVFHDVQLLKESFAVAATCLLLAALAAARAGGRAAIWLGAGAVLGVLALLRENALLLAPLLVLLALRRAERRASLVRVAAFVAGLALPLVPVAARNAALGGGFLPTTWQGGVNFWIGNNPHADGTYRPVSPGKQVPALERAEPRRIAEAETGRSLSGAEVSRFWRDRSLRWAAREPAAFARLQLAKTRLYLSWYEWPDAVDYYWTKSISPALALPLAEFGSVSLLALAGFVLARRRWRELAPVWLFEIGWAASTIVFFLFARYRLPAVPGLLVLAAVPLVALGRALREKRRAVALAGALAIAAAWAAPHLAGFRPRTGLVEFNLGRLAQEAGDAAAAERHYERALEAAPGDFLAAMNLGTLAARRGDLARGRMLLERAAALEPDSDDARANLGAAHLAAGDLAAARRELERALALNPAHAAARRNLELVAAREAGR
jgi:4-amino-4-deoxy-L-arabinose transferase-like glycosyltransferase